MRSVLVLTTIAVCLAVAPSAHAIKRVTKTYDVELFHKQYIAEDNLTVTSGDTIRICNHDNFQHRPFTYSMYNKFETIIRPGECYDLIANNPTDSARTLKLYDQIHSQERIAITVLSTNATFNPSDLPPPRSQEWAVYITQDGALCCLHDVFNYYPYKRDGELPYDLEIGDMSAIQGRSDVRILQRGFTDSAVAEQWVCGHDVLAGGRWTRNYARIGGVLVGNLPCEANISRPN